MRIGRKTIAALVMLSLALLFAPVAVAAEPAALKLVPEDALAVVVINDLAKADAQIGKIAAAAQIPAPPSLLPLIKAQVGIQEGLDDNGSAAMALMSGDDGRPFAIAILPVSDYKKLVSQFQAEDSSGEITKISVGGESALAAKKGNFAVLTQSDKKDALKKVLDGSRPITPVIGKLSDWIGDHDVAWIATPTGVKKGLAIARKSLADVKAAFANANDESAKMMAGNLDAYDMFLASAEREVSTAGVAFHVDDNGGLHVDTRTIFVPSGSWAAAGKNFERAAGTPLACLPNGSFMMAFDGTMPKGFSTGFMNLSVQMMSNMSKAAGGQPLTEEQQKKLTDAMQGAMADVRAMSMVMGPPKPGSSIYSNMAAAMKVKDSKKYMDNYQKLMASMRDAYKGTSLEAFMPQEAKKTKIGDLDGLEFTMDMSKVIEKMPNAQGAKQMMQMLFGPEAKLSVYVAAVDDSTIAISYVNSDNIARVQAACKNPQSSLAGNPDIAQTAKLLPHGAQWVVYLSPKGFMDFISTMILGMAAAGGGGPMPALPEFPKTPPIGFGAELTSTGFDLNVVVPGDTLKGIGTYIMQMKMGGAAARPGRGS